MRTETIPPDEEEQLIEYLRDCAAGAEWEGVLVTHQLPMQSGSETVPDSPFVIVVRGDGGAAEDLGLWLRRLGIRVIGPDADRTGRSTSALARQVAYWMQQSDRGAVGVAGVRAVRGPYRVQTALGRPEEYLTTELVMLGETN